jgi:hypothetical protein
MLSRRGLFGGMAGVIAAPAIVRASSLMPVRAWTDWRAAQMLSAFDILQNSPSMMLHEVLTGRLRRRSQLLAENIARSNMLVQSLQAYHRATGTSEGEA